MAKLIAEDTKIRVSSVLNRDATNFGKRYLTDGNSGTCWNSDQGTPQWVSLDFTNPVTPSEVHLQFQGGFAGKEVQIEAVDASSDTTTCADIFPEDNNALQISFLYWEHQIFSFFSEMSSLTRVNFSIAAQRTDQEIADSISHKHRYVWPDCVVSSCCNRKVIDSGTSSNRLCHRSLTSALFADSEESVLIKRSEDDLFIAWCPKDWFLCTQISVQRSHSLMMVYVAIINLFMFQMIAPKICTCGNRSVT
ncbi:uncharacterized protein LOC144098404 isoform X1 [Amblyomma americanum]